MVRGFGILAVFFSLMVFIPSAFAADRYLVNNGATETIDEHGVCKEVTNNAGGTIMVPTKAAAEWSSFRSNLPPSVTVADCHCNLPWGGTLAHGSSVTAYQSGSVSCGSSCTSQTRSCSNGSLSGSYANQSCSVAACASCSSSTINWSSCNALSGSMTHGQTKTVTNAASGYTGTRNLSCNNGAISQSGGSCTAAPPACGGYSYGGHCYYLGAVNESCDQACSTKGGCNLTGTQLMGASGTSAACYAVLDGLGFTPVVNPVAEITHTWTLGCIYWPYWGVSAA